MNQILNEDDFLEFALNSYIYKNSTTKTVFLADVKLIINFEKFYKKHYNQSKILLHNQLNMIINLFGIDNTFILLKYKLCDSSPEILNFLKSCLEIPK